MEKTRCKNLRKTLHSLYKNTGVSGYCHQVHRQYGTSHHSFHSPPKKRLQHSRLGVLWHCTEDATVSLTELESARNLAGSCLTLCNRLLTAHSDSLLLPRDSIAAWTGCLPFLGLPCFFFSFIILSFSLFFFSFSSSLSSFFLCLSSSLSCFCLSFSLLFSSRSSLRFFFSSSASFSFLSFSIILTYSFSVNTRAFIILLRLGLLTVSSSGEEKRSARYEGTSPAATKGLVIGVPLPELEADDTGVELNKGGLLPEELPCCW